MRILRKEKTQQNRGRKERTGCRYGKLMRTLILNGSPRPQGDTAHLIQALRRELPGEVEQVDAYRTSVAPCVDCRGCFHQPGCVVRDDMDAIYQLVDGADVIVLASPLDLSDADRQPAGPVQPVPGPVCRPGARVFRTGQGEDRRSAAHCRRQHKRAGLRLEDRADHFGRTGGACPVQRRQPAYGSAACPGGPGGPAADTADRPQPAAQARGIAPVRTCQAVSTPLAPSSRSRMFCSAPVWASIYTMQWVFSGVRQTNS